jgi:hypothetical protein
MVSSGRTERVQEQTLLNLSLLPSPRFGEGSGVRGWSIGSNFSQETPDNELRELEHWVLRS